MRDTKIKSLMEKVLTPKEVLTEAEEVGLASLTVQQLVTKHLQIASNVSDVSFRDGDTVYIKIKVTPRSKFTNRGLDRLATDLYAKGYTSEGTLYIEVNLGKKVILILGRSGPKFKVDN